MKGKKGKKTFTCFPYNSAACVVVYGHQVISHDLGWPRCSVNPHGKTVTKNISALSCL